MGPYPVLYYNVYFTFIFFSHIQQVTVEYKKNTHSNNHLLAGVNDTDRLVLAGSADKATIAVPGHIVNDIRMHVL